VRKLAKYSDAIFVSMMVLALVIGAVFLWSRWQVAQSYWDTNFDVYSVPPDEIVSGGTARDTRIVPIDSPTFVSVDTAKSLFRDYDPVLVLDYDGVERAYPLNILTIHEVVNDYAGDVAIAVTFCPMCDSAVIYRREVDGQVLRMGVSGNFYGNNFLMYDDLTESWWFQFTGEAVVGDMTGERLDVIPSQIVGFNSYARHYPDGDVLSGDAEHPDINYAMSPYDAYQNSSSPILSNINYDPRLDAMERVLSTTINGIPIAYPFELLSAAGVINHEIEGRAVVVFWQPRAETAINTENVGQAAVYGRELNDEILTFRYENGHIYDNQTDSEWNIFGEAISGDYEGETLYDYHCYTHFWFAWSSANPDTIIYGD